MKKAARSGLFFIPILLLLSRNIRVAGEQMLNELVCAFGAALKLLTYFILVAGS